MANVACHKEDYGIAASWIFQATAHNKGIISYHIIIYLFILIDVNTDILDKYSMCRLQMCSDFDSIFLLDTVHQTRPDSREGYCPI